MEKKGKESTNEKGKESTNEKGKKSTNEKVKDLGKGWDAIKRNFQEHNGKSQKDKG